MGLIPCNFLEYVSHFRVCILLNLILKRFRF